MQGRVLLAWYEREGSTEGARGGVGGAIRAASPHFRCCPQLQYEQCCYRCMRGNACPCRSHGPRGTAAQGVLAAITFVIISLLPPPPPSFHRCLFPDSSSAWRMMRTGPHRGEPHHLEAKRVIFENLRVFGSTTQRPRRRKPLCTLTMK